MKVTLPWSCVISKNRKYTVTRNGRMILSKAYREGKEKIYVVARKSYKGEPLEGDVSIEFVMYLPDKRRRDILNVTQIICDGLEGIAYEGDHQIAEFYGVRIEVDKDNPRVEVTVNAQETAKV